MRQMLEHRHRTDIEDIARIGLKGADAALAENDIVIAARHDVFGAHQPFLIGRGKTALQQHRLLLMTELFQQRKVLHIARTNLNDIHILERRQMLRVHDLGDNRQTGLLARDFQQLQPLEPHALKRIGRGARLESAAAEHGRAAFLDLLCNPDDLLLALDRARSRHERQRAAADLRIADTDDCRLRMKLFVCMLIGLLHALDILNNLKRRDQIRVDCSGIAHQSEDCVRGTDALVDADLLFLKPGDQALELRLIGILFQYDDHKTNFLSKNAENRGFHLTKPEKSDMI